MLGGRCRVRGSGREFFVVSRVWKSEGGGGGGVREDLERFGGGGVMDECVCCTPTLGLSHVVDMIPNLFGSSVRM